MQETMTERDLLVAYVNARKSFERLDDAVKMARAKMEQAERKLVEALTANNATSTAKYKGIGFVALSKPVLYVSCDKENEDQLFQLIRDHNMSSIIKETVHHKSLSTFVGTLIERGLQLPEFIKPHFRQGVKFYER